MLKKILYIILLLCQVTARGQQINIGFTQFTAADGLSSGHVSTVIQDSRGFIWTGTSNGITRYDGRSFKKYSTIGKGGLSDLSVMCLAEDADGNIWIGTQNGLNKLDPLTEKISRYYEGTGPGAIPYKWCNSLYRDKQNRLWLTTEKGIALYDKGTNSFLNYPVSVFGQDETINKFISKVLEDHKGRFWLATSFGVKLFDRNTKTYQSFFYKEDKGILPHSYPIMSVAEDDDGDIWAGTWGGGLLKYDEIKNEFEKVKAGGNDFGAYIISDISPLTVSSQHYLLLGTNEGILLFDNPAKQQLSHSPLNDNINGFMKDRQGNLWVAGANGLYQMNNNSLAFHWVPLPGKTTGSEVIFHIIPAPASSSPVFYLSTVDNWWQYNIVSQDISEYKIPAGSKKLLSGINDWVIQNDGYWFTSVHGLGFWNSRGNSVVDFSGLASYLSATDFVKEDKEGKLWITVHRKGLLVYSPAEKKVVSLFNDKEKADNTVGKDINDLQPGPDGYMYFTCDKKLYRVNPTDFSFTSFSVPADENHIDDRKIAPDKIFTGPGGRFFVSGELQLYELKNNQLVKMYPTTGYAPFNFGKIICTDNGTVWATTSTGLYRSDTSFRNWTNISSRVGIREDETVNDIFIYSPDTILLAANGKIGLLNVSLLNKSIAPSPVLISRIKQGAKEIYMPSLQHRGLSGSFREAIEIEISALNFTDKKETRILYQLKGWDKEYKELQGQSFVRYEQLPPGRYMFETKQVNAEGMESPVVSISFRVLPPFYLSWWFLALTVVFIAAALYAIYRYRLRKALELEKLRTRIATDLHDDIGATLSSISIYSDAVKQQVKEKLPAVESIVDKIGNNSREMVASMNDIVWAIDPKNDEGSKLVSRMQNHARDLCAAKNIILDFKADPSISTIILPLEYRKNIYLVFKEALNNALKYAEAKNISIKIFKQDSMLEMIIKDDGNGFETAAGNSGNGLKNMKERSKEINGLLHIESLPGAGTAITFNCPV